MLGKYARLEAISPRPEGTYRFSVRMKAAVPMSVTVHALGAWEIFNVTAQWARYDMVIDEADGDAVDLYPLSNNTLYVEQAQLIYGRAEAPWRPAPEDDTEYEWTTVALDEAGITTIREITGYTEYFKLDSAAMPPAKPSTFPPPTGWTTTEPAPGADTDLSLTLYRCPVTVYSDGGYEWGDVTVDGAYELAKAALNTSTEYKTIVEQLLDSWRAAVESTTINTDTGEPLAYLLGQIRVTSKNVSSLIEETRTTADGLSDRISSVQEQTSSEIVNRFTEAKAYADDQYGAAKEYVTTAESWQRFSAAGIEQGRLGSPFKTLLSNEELGFYENNKRVAYINNNKLMITRGEILDILTIGNFEFAFSNNGLGIIWSGNGGRA